MSRYWSGDNNVDTVGQPAEYPVTAIDRERWDGKQDKLVYDTAPTPGSAQPVTSDGIAHAIDKSKAFMVMYGATTIQDIAKAYAEGRCVCAEYEGLIYTLARIDAVYQRALFYCVVPAQNGRVVTHSLTLTGSEWEQNIIESTLPADFEGATDVTEMTYNEIKELYDAGKDLYIIKEGERYVCGGYLPQAGHLVFYRIYWDGQTSRFCISGYRIHQAGGWIKLTVDAYLKSTEVLNSLTSSETTKALSAAQGKELKRLIDDIINVTPAPVEGKLVKRVLGGNIITPAPIAGMHAANKDYVEQAFRALNIENGEGENSLQQNIDYASFAPTNEHIINNTDISKNEDGSVITGALGKFSTMHGGTSQAKGKRSHAEGTTTVALGGYSHAEGNETLAVGNNTHAEGYKTVAIGQDSHAEGAHSVAEGKHSHAEGYETLASGEVAHAEGYGTIANGYYQHVQGRFNDTEGLDNVAHVIGNGTGEDVENEDGSITKHRSNAHTVDWNGNAWYAGEVRVGGDNYYDADPLVTQTQLELFTATNLENSGEKGGVRQKAFENKEENIGTATGIQAFAANVGNATGDFSFASGYGSKASGGYSHAEGTNTHAAHLCTHAEGHETRAEGIYSHAEGKNTYTSGIASHAEGEKTNANNNYSHAEGYGTNASQEAAHAEGYKTTASGYASHSEGQLTSATGINSHAEGYSTKATGNYAHSEGKTTTASGEYSHSECWDTTASGRASHAEGNTTKATNAHAHSEGYYAEANGHTSHAEGNHTIANGADQHVQGKYNVADTSSAHIVGNGNSTTPSNAHTLDWNGNAWYQGDVYVGSTSGTNKDGGSKKLATEEYVDGLIAELQAQIDALKG